MTEKEMMDALSAPLKPSDVYIYARDVARDSRGKYLGLFIIHKTSRSVTERLNSVLGFDWYDEYEYDEQHNLICKLTVRIGEKTITRRGIGTPNRFEKEKSLYSDALKVASVKFNIGAELYKMPKIVIRLKDEEMTAKGTVSPTVDFKKWKVCYDYTGGEIKNLKIYDDKGSLRWE